MDYKKLKGNLGLKSSALAPTACKLSSQFLVLDHMSNHYMKIARAKSAIDSRPPKSLATSQKMRDRISRDRSGRSPLPRSHSSMSGVNMYEYEDVLKDEPEDEEGRLVHSIMRSTLLDKSRSTNNAMFASASNVNLYDRDSYVSQQMQNTVHDTHYSTPYGNMTYDHPTSVRSVKSGHSLNISASRQFIPTNIMANRTCNGDVLEKRPHLFTEPERPFTPRTLKKNSESRLKHSKCYNPPRIKENSHANNDKEKSMIHTNSSNDKETTNTQNNNEKGTTKTPNHQSPPKLNKQKKVKDFSKIDRQQTSQLTNSMLMDVTVRSQDEIVGQNVNYNVPPLAITMDKDHMNWLKEQASKAEIRVRSSGRLKSSLHSDEELHPRNKFPSHKESALEANAKKEKQKKDEEQKYLAFAKEVTDDVLSRGISTDSVLYRVFENHIERRKFDLDEGRMRKVITDLRKNLGLTNSPAKGRTLASLSDSNYNNKSGKDSADLQSSNSSHQQNASSQSATVIDKHVELSQTNLLSEFGSTMESESTLKFGQTRDFLSTINSEASRERRESETKLDRLGSENELTDTQTWKQYELSLTANENTNNGSSSSVRDEEQSDAVSEMDKGTLQHGQRRRRTRERSLAGKEMLQSDMFRGSKVQPERGSQGNGSMDFSTDGEMIHSDASHSISEHGNHEQTSEEISSSDKNVVLSQVIDHTSHKDQDIENVSLVSHSSLQRPTVKPRTRVRQGSQESTQTVTRQGSQESTQTVTGVVAPMTEDVTQNIGAHVARDVGHNNSSGLTKEEPNVDPAREGLDRKTLEDAPEVSTPENNHHIRPESTEENYEYEEDYEEAIDSQEDSHADSADDF